MSTIQNNKPKFDFYFARNKEGFVCSYDNNTHRCRGVVASTGDDIEYINKHEHEWIGQLDPKYE